MAFKNLANESKSLSDSLKTGDVAIIETNGGYTDIVYVISIFMRDEKPRKVCAQSLVNPTFQYNMENTNRVIRKLITGDTLEIS